MECPVCETDMNSCGSYGKGLSCDYVKLGDIYQCPAYEAGNHLECEECPHIEEGDECEGCIYVCTSGDHHGHFHTRLPNEEELYEGYPC